MTDKRAVLEPETFYHFYNRANGNEDMFLSDDNYLFFLRKFREHVSPVCDTYCYCLMPNHFHFLIQIKSEKELTGYFEIKSKSISTFSKSNTLEKLLSKEFSNFFSSYTQSFNKQQGRMGSLFIKNFKRKKISDKNYLLRLVHYIHFNPVEAGLCKKINEWKYSSYNAICEPGKTMIKKNEVIDWFEDLANFKSFHKNYPKEIRVEFD